MKKKYLPYLLSIIYLIFFAICLNFVIECITRNGLWYGWNFFRHHFKKFFFNSLIVFLSLTPSFLFKRRIFSITIISSLWLIFSIADNLIIKFRGTPLTGADLLMIKDGLTLAKDYLTPSTFIIIILALILLIIGLIYLFIKGPKIRVNYIVTLPAVIVFILIFPSITNYALSENIVSRNFWHILNNYNEYGFPFSFLNSIFNTGLKKPNNYSKEEILDIKNILIDKNASIPPLKPNIIFVQLESFIDLDYVNEFTFNTYPTPNFKKLKEKYPNGLLHVPALGGGTANTEFEILTSMASDFFGVGEFPFNTVLSKNTVNASGYLFKALGYNTYALHNHEGTFYNRYKVYGNLGFDAFIPIEFMSPYEKTKTDWAKDKTLTNEILTCLKSNTNPDFIYSISVQGHGPYSNEDFLDSKIKVTSTYDVTNKNSLEYYANLVNEMDTFIGQLISSISGLDEPSIIVFYGDHYPGLSIPDDEINNGNLYTTDYVIWNNINLPYKTLDLEAYQLMPYILTELKFPLPPLYNLHNSYTNKLNGIDDSNYKDFLYSLEYDILYGNNYMKNEESNTPLVNYTVGFNLPQITAIDITADKVTISGNNFNTFSKVFVNDKKVETLFINTSTLSINNSNITTNDILEVKQVSPNGTVFK